jgi:hypothetical protein
LRAIFSENRYTPASGAGQAFSGSCAEGRHSLLALRAPEGRTSVLGEAADHAAAALAAFLAFAVIDLEGMLEIAKLA